jgi:hypothetical protein
MVGSFLGRHFGTGVTSLRDMSLHRSDLRFDLGSAAGLSCPTHDEGEV